MREKTVLFHIRRREDLVRFRNGILRVVRRIRGRYAYWSDYSFAFLTFFAVVVIGFLVISLIVSVVNGAKFNRQYRGDFLRAANSTNPAKVAFYLGRALDRLESRGFTKGHTSTLLPGNPDNDLSITTLGFRELESRAREISRIPGSRESFARSELRQRLLDINNTPSGSKAQQLTTMHYYGAYVTEQGFWLQASRDVQWALINSLILAAILTLMSSGLSYIVYGVIEKLHDWARDGTVSTTG